MKKKIVALAGASGLIGSQLAMFMKEFEIIRINRKDFHLKNDVFAELFREADVIINLSGAPIIRRWTKKNRKEMFDSRIRTTRKLKCITDFAPEKQRLFISASAIGIYDEENIHSEVSTQWGEGYLAELIKEWEREAMCLASPSTKVCIIRTGVVLAESGGMIPRLLPFFRLGLGGRIGKGRQNMSWIHIVDLCRAVDFIAGNNKEGIYNMTAPEVTTNREFTRLLARVVKRPAPFMIPGILIRLMYGRGSSVLTGGQAVLPSRLIREGFQFNYQDVETALKDIVN